MLWQLFVTVTFSRKRCNTAIQICYRSYIYMCKYIYVNMQNCFGFIFSISFQQQKKFHFIPTNAQHAKENLHLEILMTKHWRFFSGFPARKCLSSALRKWRALGGRGGMESHARVKRDGTLPEIGHSFWKSMVGKLTSGVGYSHFFRGYVSFRRVHLARALWSPKREHLRYTAEIERKIIVVSMTRDVPNPSVNGDIMTSII